MEPKYTVYEDGEIAVGLFAEDAAADEKSLLHLGLRWLRPKSYQRPDGDVQNITNVMGGETQWFILPHSFGAAVGRKLIEQNVAGGLARYFNETGFNRMVSWLVEMEELGDAMCY